MIACLVSDFSFCWESSTSANEVLYLQSLQIHWNLNTDPKLQTIRTYRQLGLADNFRTVQATILPDRIQSGQPTQCSQQHETALESRDSLLPSPCFGYRQLTFWPEKAICLLAVGQRLTLLLAGATGWDERFWRKLCRGVKRPVARYTELRVERALITWLRLKHRTASGLVWCNRRSAAWENFLRKIRTLTIGWTAPRDLVTTTSVVQRHRRSRRFQIGLTNNHRSSVLYINDNICGISNGNSIWSHCYSDLRSSQLLRLSMRNCEIMKGIIPLMSNTLFPVFRWNKPYRWWRSEGDEYQIKPTLASRRHVTHVFRESGCSSSATLALFLEFKLFICQSPTPISFLVSNSDQSPNKTYAM